MFILAMLLKSPVGAAMYAGEKMTSGYDKLKPSIEFPDPQITLEEGLIAVGGILDVPTLFHAYRKGIFPWPQVGYPMLWFSPEKRGVVDFAELHISRSLEKEERRQIYHFTMNQDFKQVIDQCQKQPRKFQHGTWIVPELKKAYVRFHEAGFAHSVECWKGDELVGGIYGVYVEGVFSGESMFHLRPNTSKLAFLHLVRHLQSLGLGWMDIQMITPVTKHLGGRYISRKDFLMRLQETQVKWQTHRKLF
jgi:leucyl/phenylalanyl-tRNA--protein transferase